MQNFIFLIGLFPLSDLNVPSLNTLNSLDQIPSHPMQYSDRHLPSLRFHRFLGHVCALHHPSAPCRCVLGPDFMFHDPTSAGVPVNACVQSDVGNQFGSISECFCADLVCLLRKNITYLKLL